MSSKSDIRISFDAARRLERSLLDRQEGIKHYDQVMRVLQSEYLQEFAHEPHAPDLGGFYYWLQQRYGIRQNLQRVPGEALYEVVNEAAYLLYLIRFPAK